MPEVTSHSLLPQISEGWDNRHFDMNLVYREDLNNIKTQSKTWSQENKQVWKITKENRKKMFHAIVSETHFEFYDSENGSKTDFGHSGQRRARYLLWAHRAQSRAFTRALGHTSDNGLDPSPHTSAPIFRNDNEDSWGILRNFPSSMGHIGRGQQPRT